MTESISVHLSGPSFSLLLYDNVQCEYDQEGFILGEIVTKEKRTITDNDQEVVNVERIIKVNSAIPCPQLAYFYDNVGKINKEKISQFLGKHTKNVVGWFKFKHNPCFKLTLREKIIMKALAQELAPASPELFVCCLLTTQISSEIGSTHIYNQTIIRYQKSIGFQPIPMHIINLKDAHDIYKSSEDCSKTFKNIIKSLNLDINNSQGYANVNKIEKALDEHIAKVVKDLSIREKIMFDLEQDVLRMRTNLNIMNECSDEDFLSANGVASIKKCEADIISGDGSTEISQINCANQRVNTRRSTRSADICIDKQQPDKISYSQMTQKPKT